MALTYKKLAFAEHYLTLWDAAKAARAAGYAHASARQQGQRLLTNDDVKAYIATRLQELKIEADEVITRLTRHARGSMADFITITHGEPIFDWERAKGSGALDLVKKYKVDKDGAVSIELYDAQAALVQLGKMHHLFVERTEISVPEGLTVRFVWDDDGDNSGHESD